MEIGRPGSAPPTAGARDSLPVDVLETLLESLVCERQELRHRGAEPERLEANRVAILSWQAELARALIASHSAQSVSDSA